MNPRPLFACLACLLIAAASARAADDDAPVAVLVDGTRARGLLYSVRADGAVSFASSSEVRDLTLDDLVEWGAPVEADRGTLILLADGSIVPGELEGLADETLRLSTDHLGELAIPLELLRGVVFDAPRSSARRDGWLDRVARAEGGKDRLLLANGDELVGQFQGLAERKIAWKGEFGDLETPLDAALVVTFDPQLASTTAAGSMQALVGLEDGTLLACQRLTIDDRRARFLLAGDNEWDCDRRRVVYVAPRGPRLGYLSDLEPTGYRHVPLLNLAWPYRLDRAVTGGRLRAGGRWWPKGVGMHSASRLTFALDPADRRFEASLALDETAGGGGSVVFRVFVDSQERFASPIVHGGDPPLPISVDVAGGQSLSLVVDFAERGDQLDHADWLAARLVR